MSSSSPDSDGIVSVCCKPFQCFSSSRGGEEADNKKRDRDLNINNKNKNTTTTNRQQSTTSLSEFQDAEEGTDEQWRNGQSTAASARASLYYFDADEPDFDLNECDFETVIAYPPVITTSIKSNRRRMSVDQPKSMMKITRFAEQDEEEDEEKKEEEKEKHVTIVANAIAGQSKRMLSSKRVGMLRRSTMKLIRDLEKPGISIEEKGFPGELTSEEVVIVQEFRKELQKRDPIYSDIVYGYSKVEDEPYSLCRFLRARKFDINEVFQLLDEGKEHWIKAKQYNFYPDLQESLGGIPPSIFHMQYPLLHVGSAKNGCPVSYFNAGRINSEGILSLIPMEQVVPYFWHGFLYTFTDRLSKLQQANPNIVRCESVHVYDLQGMSRSQMNSDAIEVVKLANTITCCFPETLHCLIIINAPSFFSFAWGLVKRCIDPRTASKIEVYSGTKKGNKRLAELIDENELLADYGGKGPSSQSIVEGYQKQENEALKRRLVELMNIPKGGEASYNFNLEEGESVTINVYSRSLLGAQLSLYDQQGKSSKCIAENVSIKNDDDDVDDDDTAANVDKENNHTTPYCKQLVSNVIGPGKFCIKGKNNSKSINSFFLLVGDVI